MLKTIKKNAITMAKFRKTKKGIAGQIYSNQISTSKKRNHPKPEYSLSELREWIFSQDNFEEIYLRWVKSGYKKGYTPSVDRLDDYLGYSFDNIRLTDWETNKKKGHDDIFSGKNTKQSNKVIQYDLDGNKVAEYNSRNEAMRITGICKIGDVCNGKRFKAGGYKWEYETRRHKIC